MGKLSKYEKETIVNFNEKESEATIYTLGNYWTSHIVTVL